MRAKTAKQIARWINGNPDRTVVIAIALATAARLSYITYLGDDLGGPDSNTYDQAGWDIVRNGLQSPDVADLPFRPPGYPMLVAMHYFLFGRHPYTVQITQTAMIAGLTWLTYGTAKRMVGAKAALVAGLGMSLSLAWFALPHPLMYEPWLALFLVATTLLLLRFEEESKIRYLVAAGFMLGIASAFHNKFLSLILLFALWIGWSRRKAIPSHGWLAALALAGSAAAVVFPLVVRNQLVYHEPIPIATLMGANLVFGNNPDADGASTNQPVRPPWCPGIYIYDRSDYLGTDQSLTACAVRLALAHPLHELRILPNKFARFWATFIGPWDQLNNWRHYFDLRAAIPQAIKHKEWFQRTDLALSSLWVAGGLTLLVLGAAKTISRSGLRKTAPGLIPIIWLTSVHLATFGDPRFRIPILPLVWMFQSAAFVDIVERRTRAALPST